MPTNLSEHFEYLAQYLKPSELAAIIGGFYRNLSNTALLPLYIQLVALIGEAEAAKMVHDAKESHL